MSQLGIDLKDYQEINERFSYSLYNILGGGSFGKVYLGWDHERKRPIAVKQLLPKTLRVLRGLEQREIDSLDRLKHENIIQFYGTHGGVNNPEGLFLFLQLCQGGSLDKHIVRRRPTQAEAMNYFNQLVDGMIYVNSQQIFHRDLKPENLLLTKNSKLKIADFGTARQYANMNQDTYRRCTPVYAAPEVYLIELYEQQGGRYSQKCDVFSAGYILYELLTGQKITRGIESEADLINFLRRSRENGFRIEHPALTPRWIMLLRKMLHFDPNQRPTFPQIKEEVQRFLPPSNDPTIQRPTDLQYRRRSGKLVQVIYKELMQKQSKINNYIVLLKMMQLHESQNSGIIPRTYKLIFLYCSLSYYCRLSEEHLSYLNSPQTIVVQGREVGNLFDDMVREDKARLIEFTEENAGRLNKAIEQIRALLLRQVVPYLQEILKRQEGDIQKKAIVEVSINRAIDQLRRGQDTSSLVEQNAYRRCVNNLYQTSADLATVSLGDLHIYFVLLQVKRLMAGRRPTQVPLTVRQVVELSREDLTNAIFAQRD